MIRSARGSPPHNSASPASVDSSSHAERSPRIPVSSSVDSGNGRGPRASLRTPSRPASSRRVVISALLEPPPGSSGRTCSSEAALSRTTRRRLSLSSDRYREARSWGSPGTCWSATPRARSSSRSASSAVRGCWDMPNKSRNSTPSGKLGSTECAARTANVVFPGPAEPVMSPTTPAPGELSAHTSSLNQISSWPRPMKSPTIRGSSHRLLRRVQWSRRRPSRASSISRAARTSFVPRGGDHAAPRRNRLGPSHSWSHSRSDPLWRFVHP